MDNLIVDFYSKTYGSVRIAWPSNSEPANDSYADRRSCALLFACYTLRQMRNSGVHASTDALARFLRSWTPTQTADIVQPTNVESVVVASNKDVLYSAAALQGMPEPYLQERYGAPIVLLPYQGKGKRRFIGRLTQGRGNQPVFYLKIRGFGIIGTLMGWRMAQYGANSIALLLAELVKRFGDDASYVESLRAIAVECASAYSSRAISSLNQEGLALKWVDEHVTL